MYLFMDVIVAKQVSRRVYLASIAVKIEHTVGGHNHDILQQCISDVHASLKTE